MKSWLVIAQQKRTVSNFFRPAQRETRSAENIAQPPKWRKSVQIPIVQIPIRQIDRCTPRPLLFKSWNRLVPPCPSELLHPFTKYLKSADQILKSKRNLRWEQAFFCRGFQKMEWLAGPHLTSCFTLHCSKTQFYFLAFNKARDLSPCFSDLNCFWIDILNCLMFYIQFVCFSCVCLRILDFHLLSGVFGIYPRGLTRGSVDVVHFPTQRDKRSVDQRSDEVKITHLTRAMTQGTGKIWITNWRFTLESPSRLTGGGALRLKKKVFGFLARGLVADPRSGGTPHHQHATPIPW